MSHTVPPFDAGLDFLPGFKGGLPSYEGYPTTDRFVEAFQQPAYEAWLAKRSVGPGNRPLSMSLRLPFLGSPNLHREHEEQTLDRRCAAEGYLGYLSTEIALRGSALHSDRALESMHWDIGMPDALRAEDLQQLMHIAREHFELKNPGNRSVGLAEGGGDSQLITVLAGMGFTSLRLAIDEETNVPELGEAIAIARRLGFLSVAIALKYGRKGQTLMQFNAALADIVALAPDRIFLYDPGKHPIVARDAAQGEAQNLATRVDMFKLASLRLAAAGYTLLGADAFCRPADELAIAQRRGRLSLGLDGYTTHANCDLVACGVGQVGIVGPTYSQNWRELRDYYADLERGALPIERGLELSADDLLRRTVIQALLCHCEMCVETFETAYLIDFASYFAPEIKELKQLEQHGLVRFEDNWIAVTSNGRPFLGNICALFDKYLRAEGRTLDAMLT
jgi:oxygen-independent coproporphyrinogen III oxidase